MARSRAPSPPEPAAGEFIPPVRRIMDRRYRGGAWKVAYADFVTALMALFIVLWMMNGSAQVKQSVSGYFSDPRGYAHKHPGGPVNNGQILATEKDSLGDIQKQVEAVLSKAAGFDKLRDNVKFSMTPEGLRIDLLENEQGLFFVTGSSRPTEAGTRLLSVLGSEIGKMPNPMVIEGHTDALPFRNAVPTSGYGNWDLSTDRANEARRLLTAAGLRPQQVVELRGYADQKLLKPEAPQDPRNRRISLVVRFHAE